RLTPGQVPPPAERSDGDRQQSHCVQVLSSAEMHDVLSVGGPEAARVEEYQEQQAKHQSETQRSEPERARPGARFLLYQCLQTPGGQQSQKHGHNTEYASGTAELPQTGY